MGARKGFRGAQVAIATRISGDLYDVTYPGRAECDRAVPWRYLDGLRRDGWSVEVDQRTCRGEGEPGRKSYPPL